MPALMRCFYLFAVRSSVWLIEYPNKRILGLPIGLCLIRPILQDRQFG